MLTVVHVTAAGEVRAVRELFAEYARAVDEPRCFEGFERELAALPQGYDALLLAPPGAGCVGLRRLDATAAEVKRLYVRPDRRCRGLGRALAAAALDWARAEGCKRVVLDSLPKMHEAIALYRSLGFVEVAPYLEAPTPGAICFELRL